MAEVNEDSLDVDQDQPEWKPNKSLFKEIFFITNDTQSNIYCSAKLRYPATTQERFLIGNLNGKVSCLERKEVYESQEKFHSSHDMQSRDIDFIYIPKKAELISMDAFYRTQTVRSTRCLIVGVTLILLNLKEPPKYYFNIYNALEPGTEFDLDKLAQVCQHQSLNFIPYHLYHADIYNNSAYETVFLLAGSDERIHVFVGDSKVRFEEKSCKKYFPEFLDIPGRVIWMSVTNCDSFKRLSAVGCDNGYVRLSLTDVRKVETLKTWSITMDGPVTSVHLFTLESENEIIFSQSPLDGSTVISPRFELSDIDQQHLLVTSALEVSVVFLDVATKGLDDMIVLDQSDQFDSVTCSRVKDIDCDGKKEIILGTYGQELLVYKWYRAHDSSIKFRLFYQKQFSKPLLSIHSLDMMGDGLQELVVVSLTGVHILQHDVQLGAEKLLIRIAQAFSKNLTLDDMIEQSSRSTKEKTMKSDEYEKNDKQKEKVYIVNGSDYIKTNGDDSIETVVKRGI